MAVATVTADVSRVAVATIATDTGTWGNDGGGGGVSDEPDIVYQGSTAQSRKVSTSVIGRNYTHGSGTDMDGTPANTAHYLAKIAATNYGVLLTRTSPALHMKLGSGSGDYYSYYLFGNDNYPPRGGFQIVAIAPSVAGYRDATTGTPNTTSILYWSLLGDFSATSKSENVVIDAIDVGLGLCVVGGDGASADATFDDFVSFDEGTSGNRYGFVYTEGGVLFWTGQMCIGQNSSGTSTLTEFTDSGVTVVWNNGLVTTGFHRLLLDIATTSTALSMTNCSFGSLGQIDNDGDRGYTTTEDSRPILQVTGTAGTVALNSCVIDNFASFDLNAQTTLDTCVITDSGQVDAGTGADLGGTSISGYTGAADTSSLVWDVNLDPDGELDGMTFAKGATAHHAIEFGTTSPLTMTLRNWTTTGFNASDAQNDSTFQVLRTTGTVTINVIGGTGNFSYKSAGATVNVVLDPVTVSVHVDDNTGASLQNARVAMWAADGTVSITRSASTATVAHTAHGMATGDYVVIGKGVDQVEYSGIHQITVTGANAYTYTVSGTPATPATGTIEATGAFLSGLTDVSGDISRSRVVGTDTPVEGFVRLSSTSPRFKTFSLAGNTVDNIAGLAVNVRLVLDE